MEVRTTADAVDTTAPHRFFFFSTEKTPKTHRLEERQEQRRFGLRQSERGHFFWGKKKLEKPPPWCGNSCDLDDDGGMLASQTVMLGFMPVCPPGNKAGLAANSDKCSAQPRLAMPVPVIGSPAGRCSAGTCRSSGDALRMRN